MKRTERFCGAKTAIFAAICLAAAIPASVSAQNVILPTPEQLVTMTIEQRLALFRAMQALPQNQRDANLNALRGEIDALTPDQKRAMSDHFKAEFQSLPPDRQSEVLQELGIAQGK